MAIVLAVIAIVVLLVIFGFSKKNVASGAGGLLSAILVGGMGIALLGTAIAFPPFALAIVVFFVLKGLMSKK